MSFIYISGLLTRMSEAHSSICLGILFVFALYGVWGLWIDYHWASRDAQYTKTLLGLTAEQLVEHNKLVADKGRSLNVKEMTEFLSKL